MTVMDSGCSGEGPMSFLGLGPCPRRDHSDLLIGHLWKPGEDISQVGVGVDSFPAAVLNDGVEDGRTLTGLGIAEEQPVFLVMRSFA